MIKTSVFILAAALGFGSVSTVLFRDTGPVAANQIIDATVHGFGAATVGGEGGRVVQVTSRADSGIGTLRWALEELTEPRVIQFEVSGVIPLESQIEVGSNVTILGGSSPGIVTITGGRLRVVGDNVIIRGLRIRPGDKAGAPLQNRDAISIGKAEIAVRNVVIDGNSLTWATDENLAIWGEVSDVTISNNIIAHGLEEAGHPDGDHSMGLLIGGGNVSRISVIGNLFAHNKHRNPAIKDESHAIEFVNNVVYNWGDNGFTADDSTVHILGNVFVPGEDSVDRAPIAVRSLEEGPPLYYYADNDGDVRGTATAATDYLFESSDVDVMPASEVYDWVLARAGARNPRLDGVDSKMIADILKNRGHIINSPAELGRSVLSQGSYSSEK